VEERRPQHQFQTYPITAVSLLQRPQENKVRAAICDKACLHGVRTAFGRLELRELTVLRVCLARGPEKREHSSQLGIHLRKPG
jgi:hypothetical protein